MVSLPGNMWVDMNALEVKTVAAQRSSSLIRISALSMDYNLIFTVNR